MRTTPLRAALLAVLAGTASAQTYDYWPADPDTGETLQMPFPVTWGLALRLPPAKADARCNPLASDTTRQVTSASSPEERFAAVQQLFAIMSLENDGKAVLDNIRASPAFNAYTQGICWDRGHWPNGKPGGQVPAACDGPATFHTFAFTFADGMTGYYAVTDEKPLPHLVDMGETPAGVLTPQPGATPGQAQECAQAVAASTCRGWGSADPLPGQIPFTCSMQSWCDGWAGTSSGRDGTDGEQRVTDFYSEIATRYGPTPYCIVWGSMPGFASAVMVGATPLYPGQFGVPQ